jgi:hypothetical protein
MYLTPHPDLLDRPTRMSYSNSGRLTTLSTFSYFQFRLTRGTQRDLLGNVIHLRNERVSCVVPRLSGCLYACIHTVRRIFTGDAMRVVEPRPNIRADDTTGVTLGPRK